MWKTDRMKRNDDDDDAFCTPWSISLNILLFHIAACEENENIFNKCETFVSLFCISRLSSTLGDIMEERLT